MSNKPRKMFVENIGWVTATKEEPIEYFGVNGEMSVVPWYKQGNKEYNGKYVVMIEYF